MKTLTVLLLLFMTSTFLYPQLDDYVLQSYNSREPVTAVQVSPDGKWILAGFENGTLRILDINDLRELLVVENAGTAAIYDIEMTPKMDLIFIASGSTIRGYDTTGVKITNWSPHKNTMWSMDIDKTGRYLVSTEVNKTFQLFDIFNGEVVQPMKGHEEVTFAVAFSPDGKYIASGSNDKKVFIWDFATKEVIATFQGLSDNIYDVAFSPDGKFVAACSQDKTVRIWNIEKKEMHQLLKGHQDMVLEIEFSPDGKYLLSASADRAIKLWDVATGDQLYAYLENEGSIPDIQFLPGGKSFVSACMDGSLKIRSLDPEIFVMHYYRDEMESEMKNDPLFLPRQQGEKRSDFEAREQEASAARSRLMDRYYQEYLEKQ